MELIKKQREQWLEDPDLVSGDEDEDEDEDFDSDEGDLDMEARDRVRMRRAEMKASRMNTMTPAERHGAEFKDLLRKLREDDHFHNIMKPFEQSEFLHAQIMNKLEADMHKAKLRKMQMELNRFANLQKGGHGNIVINEKDLIEEDHSGSEDDDMDFTGVEVTEAVPVVHETFVEACKGQCNTCIDGLRHAYRHIHILTY